MAAVGISRKLSFRAATYNLGAGVISGIGTELRWTPVSGSFATSRLSRNFLFVQCSQMIYPDKVKGKDFGNYFCPFLPVKFFWFKIILLFLFIIKSLGCYRQNHEVVDTVTTLCFLHLLFLCLCPTFLNMLWSYFN